VIVDAWGAGGARFRTSLVLFNVSGEAAAGSLEYVAAEAVGAGGSGSVPFRLRAREQVVLEDATAWLREAGLAIPEANPDWPQAGSLAIRTTEGPPDGVVAVATVSTPSGAGKAGTGLWSVPRAALLAGSAYLPGLRQTAAERTNVSVVHAGGEGALTLRASFSDGVSSFEREIQLEPGQWWQWNAPLAAAGMETADVRIDRVGGEEPWAAYATVVDGVTGDGSYLPARAFPPEGPEWIPVVVEVNGLETEVTLYAPGLQAARATLAYTDALAGTAGSLEVPLPPSRSVSIPRFVEAMRVGGAPVGPASLPHAGLLRAGAATDGVPGPFLAWARTTASGARGGTYGVAYPSLAGPDLARTEAWVAGLLPSAGTRSNVAFLNPMADAVTLEWRVFSGATGEEVPGAGGTLTLGANGWWQEALPVETTGRNVAVRIRKVSGKGPFAAYGVVNDGATPGLGTGDGSYRPMVGAR
jgi:hypothetical protein